MQKHRAVIKNNENATRRFFHLWKNLKGDPANKSSNATHSPAALHQLLLMFVCAIIHSKVSPPLFPSSLKTPPPSPHLSLLSSPCSFPYTFILFCLSTNNLQFFPKSLPPSHFQLCVYFFIALIGPKQRPQGSSSPWAGTDGQQLWGQSRILSIVWRRGKEVNSSHRNFFPLFLLYMPSCFTC